MGLLILLYLGVRISALSIETAPKLQYPSEAATAIERCLHDEHAKSLTVVLGPNLPPTAAILLRELHTQSLAPIMMQADAASDFFVLVCNRKNDVLDAMSTLKNSTSWNSRARFVVVVPAALDDVSKMFKGFQSFKVFNVVIVYPSEDGRLRVASYDPFKAKLTEAYVDVQSSCSFFPNKFLDLNKHPIRATAFPLFPRLDISRQEDGQLTLSGCDGNIFNTLVQHLNAVAEISTPTDGDWYGFYNAFTKKYTGTLGEVADGKVDISVNSRFLKALNVSRNLYPHDQDDLVVIVPKSLSVPQYMKLFLPFATATWAGFTVCVCAVAACWFLVFKTRLLLHLGLSNGSLLGRSAFETYRSLFTGAFSPPPVDTWVRAFLGVWLLFCLVMTNAFQGSLIGYLALPKFLPEMETLDDVRASGLPVAMYGDLAKTLPPDGVAGIAMRRFYSSTSLDASCAEVAVHRNTTLACNEYYARYMVRKAAFSVDGVPLLHVIAQRFRVMYVTYAVPNDSPLAPRLDVLMQRLMQAGLPAKWTRDTLHDATLRRLLASASSTVGSAVPLSVAHLQTGFFLLAGGLLASLLAFAAELLVTK